MTIILTGRGSIVYCYFKQPPQNSDITLLRDWLAMQRGTVTLCGAHAADMYAELLTNKPANCQLNYRNKTAMPDNKDWQLTLNGVQYETC